MESGNVIMTGDPGEWLKQAEYDMETADVLIGERRYIHVIFLCHLSLEKALKRLYTKETRKAPPKTHSLVYLVDLIGVPVPDACFELIQTLDGVSIPTRYPPRLDDIISEFDASKTTCLYHQAREMLTWLKQKY
jgi:HEPN domain-containing protein